MKIEEACDSFRKGFAAGRMAQAYVVVSPPRGPGLELAHRVLGLLYCADAGAPCGDCRGCRQVAAHAHPDVLWVEPQLKSRRISVEQVRELQGLVYQTAYAGGWKACVMIGADRLGKEAANAFLKTLEEPPARTLFLLLTDAPQFLLPTVVSRCQKVVLSEPGVGIPAAWREETLKILSSLERGRASDIVRLAAAERLGRVMAGMKEAASATETELAERAPESEAEGTLDARTHSRYREMRRGLMELILSWFRDVLILVVEGQAGVLANAEAEEDLRRQAERMSLAEALRNIEAVEVMNRRMEENMPENTVVHSCFAVLG